MTSYKIRPFCPGTPAHLLIVGWCLLLGQPDKGPSLSETHLFSVFCFVVLESYYVLQAGLELSVPTPAT